MNTKQVLIWRADLRNVNGQKVRSGKMAAQLAHASMGVLLNLGHTVAVDGSPDYFMFPLVSPALESWIEGSFTKICVYVNSEQELLDLETKAKDAGIINCLITDNGLTEFGRVLTRTCLSIGPALSEDIDKITGHLPLL